MNEIKEINHKCQMLYNVVDEMSIAAGVLAPALFLVNSDSVVNACSCGTTPENSSIFVTKGLLKLLNRNELQGVVAHEMSHIINKDTVYLLYAQSTPLRFMAKSREYLSDAYACQYTRNPKGLANALIKIKNYKILNNWYPVNGLLKDSFIVPVFEGKNFWNCAQPSTENRIKILMNMTSADYIEYEKQYQKLNHKKLIPESELRNSKKIEIEETEEKPLNLTVMNACALNNKIVSSEEVKIIKENKKVIKENIQKDIAMEDFIREIKGYSFIDCDCGTKLKIPPEYKTTIIICPHCGRKHNV